ncbi:hypothetical protein HYU13_03275 [Candidatus Woesearchaeota archaeon]|nr:hypothetical protein [Candidatus Woesearchaeota archaeon]
MSEKKIVVENRELAYDGPFEVQRFFEVVERWIEDNGMEKEVKMKREYVSEQGKDIEWTIEIFHHLSELALSVVRMRALFQEVTAASIKKKGRERRLNKGKALIIFDAFLETHLHGMWQQKGWFYFFRAAFEHYIYKFQERKYDGVVAGYVESLYGSLKSFFEEYTAPVEQAPRMY